MVTDNETFICPGMLKKMIVGRGFHSVNKK